MPILILKTLFPKSKMKVNAIEILSTKEQLSFEIGNVFVY
jgi:hypothetical protein